MWRSREFASLQRRPLLEPPEPFVVFLSLLPALSGGVFAGCASILSTVPHARQAALLETLSGRRRHSLERFLASESKIRGRWLLLEALGLASSATLLTGNTPSFFGCGLAVAAFVLVTLALRATAAVNPESFVTLLLSLLKPFDQVMSPISDPLVFLLKPLKGLYSSSSEQSRSDLKESEVSILVNEGEQSGALAHDQSEMIRNVLEFGDTHAGDLMVPRIRVTALELSTPASALLSLVSESEHSRYPVYREKIDNVVGILHLKDLFLFMSRSSSNKLVLEKLLRKAAFVPETQPASAVLQEMRAGRHHMSIVTDEYGGMSGIVTLEDLLEEIVGDIRDEYDDDESPIVKLQNGHYMVDASMPIAELEREAGIELPESGEYNSVGGFLVDELGCVPTEGTVLEHDGLRFTIRSANERRISRVEIASVDLKKAV